MVSPFVDAVLSYHIRDEDYLLGADGWPAKPARRPSAEEREVSASRLLQQAVDLRHAQGFTSEDTRKLACCAFQSLRNLTHPPKAASAQLCRKEREAFWNFIGHDAVQRRDETTKLFEDLVIANHLHCIVNRLGLCNEREAVSILVNGQWIPLSGLSQKPSDDGIEFYHEGALAFRVKKDYTLDGYFFCGDRGLIPGSAAVAAHEALDRGTLSTPADGSYYVIVGTALRSQAAPSLFSDHGYLGLVNAGGRTTYFGQFETAGHTSCRNASAPYAHKTVGVEAPDRFTELPFTSFDVKETKLKIIKKQYEKLKEVAIQDVSLGLDGSFLKDNCAGYVVQTLKKAGIQATARISPVVFFWKWAAHALFSPLLAEKISNRIDALPKWAVAALHFEPISYITNLIFHLMRSLMSYEKKLGYRNIFHIRYFLQAVFCPWTLSVNHPLALRAWQISQEQKNLSP